MAGRIFPISVRRRQPVYTVILAIVALCLRLVSSAAMPALPTGAAPLDIVAAFGEHALCIAAAAEGDASSPTAPAPPQGDHGDHECPGCCTVAALDASTLPRGLAIRIRFAPVTLASVAEEPPPLSSYRMRPAEPRGPPALG